MCQHFHTVSNDAVTLITCESIYITLYYSPLIIDFRNKSETFKSLYGVNF